MKCPLKKPTWWHYLHLSVVSSSLAHGLTLQEILLLLKSANWQTNWALKNFLGRCIKYIQFWSVCRLFIHSVDNDKLFHLADEMTVCENGFWLKADLLEGSNLLGNGGWDFLFTLRALREGQPKVWVTQTQGLVEGWECSLRKRDGKSWKGERQVKK